MSLLSGINIPSLKDIKFLQALRFGKKARVKGRVGLDIGTHSIKVAEITRGVEKHIFTRFGIKNIAGSQGQPLADAVTSLLEETGISSKDLNISIPGSDVVVRFVNMPVMPLPDLKSAMRFESEKYIPFSIDEVYIDCCILKERVAGKAEMLVLLAAAKKNAVDEKIGMLAEKGFNISVIDIDTFAAFNAFSASQKDTNPGKSIALINIGGSSTNVLIAKADIPYFTRDIKMGGHDVESAASADLGTETPEAPEAPKEEAHHEEKHHKGRHRKEAHHKEKKRSRTKKGHRAKEPEKPKEAEKPKEPVAIQEGQKTVLNNIMEEVKLSFGYYENQSGENVNGVYLSGGLTHMIGLADFIEESLGVKPVIWDPVLGFELGPDIDPSRLEKVKSELAVSIGMALRG